jgi:hypothetical protein
LSFHALETCGFGKPSFDTDKALNRTLFLQLSRMRAVESLRLVATECTPAYI